MTLVLIALPHSAIGAANCDNSVSAQKQIINLQTKDLTIRFLFLVADTRLYTLPCRSVGRYVGPSHFLNSKRFSHYCSCPTVRDWFAVYPALFLTRSP